jgi:hypothetical protein
MGRTLKYSFRRVLIFAGALYCFARVVQRGSGVVQRGSGVVQRGSGVSRPLLNEAQSAQQGCHPDQEVGHVAMASHP